MAVRTNPYRRTVLMANTRHQDGAIARALPLYRGLAPESAANCPSSATQCPPEYHRHQQPSSQSRSIKRTVPHVGSPKTARRMAAGRERATQRRHFRGANCAVCCLPFSGRRRILCSVLQGPAVLARCLPKPASKRTGEGCRVSIAKLERYIVLLQFSVFQQLHSKFFALHFN